MPKARNFFRIRFVWLSRAAALRRWYHAIFLAALASSFSSARGDDKPQERTSAAIAVCNWQTVSSGFSPPRFLSHSRQEQVAHRRQNQVAFQSQVAAAFVLIQADLALLVLKATFHTPARECHQEQDLDAGLRGCAAHEEFQLAGIKDVSGHQQVKGLTRQAVISFDWFSTVAFRIFCYRKRLRICNGGVALGSGSSFGRGGAMRCTVGGKATPAAGNARPHVPCTSLRSRNRLPSCPTSAVCNRSRSAMTSAHSSS